MSEEEMSTPHVNYWLSPDTKHDCYFIVGPASGPNKRIGSFKAFLTGYSEPFRAMLQDSELKEQGDILIVDIHPDTFTYFLKCLYMNCENITKEKVSFEDCIDLLYVADKYLVTYLKEKLFDYMLCTLQNALKLDDIFIVLSNPVVLHEKRLEETLCKIIPSKINEIFSSPLFLNISSDSLLWIVKLDDVGTNEITLWKELLKWAIHNTDSKDGSVLRQYMLKHLQFIRFCSMSCSDFCKKVVPTDILTRTEVYEICKSFSGDNPPNMDFICNNTIVRHDSNNKPGSTYPFCINNIDKFDKEIMSPTFTLKGLEWSVNVRKNNDYLAVYLYINGNNPTSNKKHLIVDVKFVLISHGGENISKGFIRDYSNDSNWGFPKFCTWSEMMNPLNEYIFHNSITLLVCIND